MKKYRLQEGVAGICFRCGKKILSKDDMAWYKKKDLPLRLCRNKEEMK